MNKLNLVFLISAFLLSACYQVASADETAGEKVQASGKTVKRGMKKGLNRTKEFFCTAGDLTCEARKAKHRMGEIKDKSSDKVEKTANKID